MGFIRERSYYPFVIDHKPGFFLNWFLYMLFKHVRFDENMTEDLRQMNRRGTVIYAIKYRGRLDYLLYHYLFRKSRLPYPKIGFDLNMAMILPFTRLFKVAKFYLTCFFKHGRLPNPYENGFFKNAIMQGTTSLFCLVDPKGFARHFIHSEKDSLNFLIEIQKDLEKPIYIVPQLILFKKTPEKKNPNLRDIFFGFKDKPGFIRKIGLFFRYHRKAFVDFGRPLDLKAYIMKQPAMRHVDEMAAEIRQMLIQSIDGQKRVILGPVMKSRQQFKEQVLRDRDITKVIDQMASGNTKRARQIRKKAGEYFDEIAADYNVAYVQLFHIVLTWLWKKIFQGIDVDEKELGVVREWARNGSIIYLPSHKSHIDYLVLNDVLYKHHTHVPRVAAGKNLSFWPMGHIFRKSGAFFIRRTFKGTKMYTKIFSRYIKALIEENHPLEFFIEGGRSRSGKLILPKIGFLSILLQAHREGYCDDLIFVPASINYDRVLEEKSYLKEIGGGVKERESFKQVFKARRFLKQRYGKIYIRFGQPISLNEYLTARGHIGEGMHRHLAFHLIRSINKITLVTPLALIALAILTRHRRGFHLYELTDTSETILSFLKKNKIPTATTLNHLEKALWEGLSLLIDSKVVDLIEDYNGPENLYCVDDVKKPELDYYKNSIIHYFVSHAFVAVSLLTGRDEVKTKEAIFADYQFLTNLFQNEFIYNEDDDIEKDIERVKSYFLDVSFVTWNSANAGFQLTRLGFDKLPIWGALAKTFLESYWIATQAFIHKEGKKQTKTDLLKNMNSLGQHFYKLGLIEHMEAISQLSFKNAIQFVNRNILQDNNKSDQGGPDSLERLSRFGKRLYELSHYRA